MTVDRKFLHREMPTLDVLALAFAAQRKNGTLYKEKYLYLPEAGPIAVVPNKNLIRDHVAGEAPLFVTDQDRENAEHAREFLIDYHALNTLQENRITEFVQSMIEHVKSDTVNTNKFGLMAHVPEQVANLMQQQSARDTLQTLVYTSEHFGREGDRLEFAITVLNSKFVAKFGCYFVFGHTPENNCVGFFTSKGACTVSGIYQGKVKRHNIDAYRNNVKVTEFNYVKPAFNYVKPAELG